MTPETPRQSRIELLADLMSNISESCWAAGWLDGTEYVLWNMINSNDRDWGQGAVTESQILELRDLSTELNGWIYWNEKTAETFIPLQDWLEMFNARWKSRTKND